MNEASEGQVLPLPIDPQIVSQQAQSTIKSLVDAIVELVTNSDDSYRGLEGRNAAAGGDVLIHVIRAKGGSCPLLELGDHAEGMDWQALERAVTFAASTSGFFEGRKVRGLFGRGLKEAIVGLGRGEIRTVHNGQESLVEIFTEQARTPKYRVVRKSRPTDDPPGTQIMIEVLSPKIRCPKFDILYHQLSNHFALRDILRNQNRLIQLRLDDVDVNRTRQLIFDEPVGEKRLQQELQVDGFGRTSLEVYESDEKLEFAVGDPGSVAGILVKTEAAILDSRLFGFEAEEAAHYFYGSVDCPGIADCIRRGDLGVLDPNRSGLDWRHSYCRSLDAAVKEAIRPLVYGKRQQIESKGQPRVRNEYRKKLSDLCRLLNALVESELEDLPEWGITGKEINTLVVRPEIGYAEPNEPRVFSVYVPARLLVDRNIDPKAEIELIDVKGNVELSMPYIALEPHKKHENLLSGRFSLVGRSFGDRAYAVVRMERLEDMAELRVQAPGQTRRKRLAGTNSGLFREIEFDPTPDPIQRVSFSEGTMKVYLKFPPLSDYLKPGGQGIDTPQGSLMLAELVGEGFCREVARRRLEAGLAQYVEGGEIDAFNNQVNQLMRRHLGAIHHALVT